LTVTSGKGAFKWILWKDWVFAQQACARKGKSQQYQFMFRQKKFDAISSSIKLILKLGFDKKE
jgi:hypothetical protein